MHAHQLVPRQQALQVAGVHCQEARLALGAVAVVQRGLLGAAHGDDGWIIIIADGKGAEPVKARRDDGRRDDGAEEGRRTKPRQAGLDHSSLASYLTLAGSILAR